MDNKIKIKGKTLTEKKGVSNIPWVISIRNENANALLSSEGFLMAKNIGEKISSIRKTPLTIPVSAVKSKNKLWA